MLCFNESLPKNDRNKYRVIFPESSDTRVIQVARQLLKENIAQPIFLKTPLCEVPGAIVFASDPNKENILHHAAQRYCDNNASRGLAPKAAREEVEANELLLSALLVSLGYAHVGMAGTVSNSPDVLRAGIRGIGIDDHSKVLSGCFLMLMDERKLTFADCVVVPDPTAEELAHIAISSAKTHEAMTGEVAHVALLSFSTKGSARHNRIDKVHEALTLINQLAPDLRVDGELQFDTAIAAEVAAKKAPDSSVAGKANVLVFPNLEAGNIGYKIAERLAGARAIGPVIQGLKKPWIDMSRGCTGEDLMAMTKVACSLV